MSDQQQQNTEVVATEPAPATEQATQLPADHPLVRTLAAQKETIKELRDKAHRLDEIEESQKTETQKAAERLAEAEQKAAVAEARAIRREVALEHRLTGDDAVLLDTIVDEDAMRRLAQRLAADADKSQKNHVPREGNNPRPAATSSWDSVLGELDRQRQT